MQCSHVAECWTANKLHGSRARDIAVPEVMIKAKRLARRSPKTGERRSLREIARELAALGYLSRSGRPYGAESVKRMLAAKARDERASAEDLPDPFTAANIAAEDVGASRATGNTAQCFDRE